MSPSFIILFEKWHIESQSDFCMTLMAILIQQFKNQILCNIAGEVFFNPTKYICIQGTNKIGPSYADWTYDDGTPMPYTNWDQIYNPAQPENKSWENMVLIARIEGAWHDFIVNYGRDCLVVCEKLP